MKYVAAIDQGITSTRCLTFDHNGHIKSAVHKEHEQIYTRLGWDEHNPIEILANVGTVFQNSLQLGGI